MKINKNALLIVLLFWAVLNGGLVVAGIIVYCISKVIQIEPSTGIAIFTFIPALVASWFVYALADEYRNGKY